MRMFSAMGLRETAPRASSQHQQVTATQSQTPTQTQAPDTPQDNGSSTVTAETSSERAGAGTDEHQESKPDVAKEESSAPTVEGGKLTIYHIQHRPFSARDHSVDTNGQR